MWRTDTIWFDLAVLMTLIVVGNILLGHFEQHKPKWRRILKVALAATIFVALITTTGRAWGYAFLAVPLVGALAVHCWWLPKHGINGWTAEPRDKYLELVGAKPRRSNES